MFLNKESQKLFFISCNPYENGSKNMLKLLIKLWSHISAKSAIKLLQKVNVIQKVKNTFFVPFTSVNKAIRATIAEDHQKFSTSSNNRKYT